MYCKKCGKPIQDTDAFCPYCGQQLRPSVQPNNKTKDNKKFIIIGALAAVVVVAVCLVIFLNPLSKKSYDEYMDEGKNYLLNEDYDKAKDSFLNAYEFDEKEPEVYSYLYLTYSELGDSENAEKIDNEAQNLESSQKKEYVETVNTVIEENKIENVNTVTAVSDYKVIDENVDDFDTTPLKVSDTIYLVLRDGKYYYMDNNNTVLQGPFKKAILRDFSNHVSYCGIDNSNACINEAGKEVAYGIGGVSYSYFYLDGDTVELEVLLDTSSSSSLSYTQSMVVRQGVAGNDFTSYYQKDYYIWSNNGESVFGPYSVDEAATFGMIAHLPVYENMEMATTTANNELVEGLFYVKTDKGYVVYDQSGENHSSQVFDSATPLSDDYMKVTLNNKTGIIDKNFNFVVYGNFEDISVPMNNKCYAKIDGKWQLIEIQENTDNNEDSKVDLSNVNVGDTITFGSYNGEDLQWDVVENNDSTLTLLCKSGVEEVKYCETNQAVTWNDSTIRSWLNNDFYSEAFSNSEKDVMTNTTGEYVRIPDSSIISNLYDYSTGWYDTNSITSNAVSYWVLGDYQSQENNRYQATVITGDGFLTHTTGTNQPVDATGIYARPVIYVKAG